MDSGQKKSKKTARRERLQSQQDRRIAERDEDQVPTSYSRHSDTTANVRNQNHMTLRQRVDTRGVATSYTATSLNPAATAFTPVTRISAVQERWQTPRSPGRGLHTRFDAPQQEPLWRTAQSEVDKARRRAPVEPPATPIPTRTYLAQSLLPPVRLASPRRLLVVLDLNGTLIVRNRSSGTFKQRPGLQNLLSYLFQYHVPMVFTSARPENVKRICETLFTPQQRHELAAIWARDRLGLTQGQYIEKVQVYKRLDQVWNDKDIQTKHSEKEAAWSQSNTVLVDDSMLKGTSQPHNLLLVPEFERSTNETESDGVLRELVLKLEELRMQTDVSRLIRRWQAGTVPAPKLPIYRKGQENSLEAWLAVGAAPLRENDHEEKISQNLNTLIESTVAIGGSDGQDDSTDEEDKVQKELREQMARLATGQREPAEE